MSPNPQVTVVRAPLALSCEGELLLNTGRFDDTSDLERALAAARKSRGDLSPRRVFIGVVLGPEDEELVEGRKGKSIENIAWLVHARRTRKGLLGEPTEAAQGAQATQAVESEPEVPAEVKKKPLAKAKKAPTKTKPRAAKKAK